MVNKRQHRYVPSDWRSCSINGIVHVMVCRHQLLSHSSRLHAEADFVAAPCRRLVTRTTAINDRCHHLGLSNKLPSTNAFPAITYLLLRLTMFNSNTSVPGRTGLRNFTLLMDEVHKFVAGVLNAVEQQDATCQAIPSMLGHPALPATGEMSFKDSSSSRS
jgi:hypothetical protein